MTTTQLPLLIEAEQLLPRLNSSEIVVVDLSKISTHNQAHIPGAHFLDYDSIVTMRKPAAGLLPETEIIEKVLSTHGIGNQHHVIAYDDEGGGKAARLLWTLECMGHQRFSLLNGGLHAWLNENHPLTDQPTTILPAEFSASPDSTPIADRKYIQGKLDDSNTVLLDARTADEYSGARRFAQRGGHIPGAVHFDWMMGMDTKRNMRMLAADTLLAELANRRVTPDKEVITYCHTHHRSSYSYIMLKIIGFAHIKGYPGSWSDWGNRSETPIETDA